MIPDGSFGILARIRDGAGLKINYTTHSKVILERKNLQYNYRSSNIKLGQNIEGTTSEQSLENFVEIPAGIGSRAGRRLVEDACELIHDEFLPYDYRND